MYFNVICKSQIIYIKSTLPVLKQKQVCCNERKHDLLLYLKTAYFSVRRYKVKRICVN